MPCFSTHTVAPVACGERDHALRVRPGEHLRELALDAVVQGAELHDLAALGADEHRHALQRQRADLVAGERHVGSGSGAPVRRAFRRPASPGIAGLAR